jgi:cytochrome b561
MYHIIEMQSYNHKDGEQWSVKPSTIVTPIPQFEDLNEAKSAYHQKLAYAYQSKVDIHTVAILDHTGAVIESECVSHGQAEEK